MNTPLMSASYDTSSDFPALGSFSIDNFESISGSTLPAFSYEAKSEPQFHIIVKRADGLYKALHILNTLLSIFAVLMVVATFVMVFYSLVTITEVSQMVSQIKEHNTLNPATP